MSKVRCQYYYFDINDSIYTGYFWIIVNIPLLYDMYMTFSLQQVLHDSTGRILHFINLAAVIIFPAIVVLYIHPNPGEKITTFTLFFKTICFIDIKYISRNTSIIYAGSVFCSRGILYKLHISFSVFSSIALSVYSVAFLKLISYKQVNKWMRDSYLSSDNQMKVKRKRLKSTSGRGWYHTKPNLNQIRLLN